jgi:hypothetical protein
MGRLLVHIAGMVEIFVGITLNEMGLPLNITLAATQY